MGAVYRVPLVKSVKDFGCFVEILPGKEALCHISELSAGHTKKVTDVCDVGDVIDVKVLELRDNKVRVSKGPRTPRLLGRWTRDARPVFAGRHEGPHIIIIFRTQRFLPSALFFSDFSSKK